MPFPATNVVPSNWGAHHGEVSERAQNARVSVIVGETAGGWTPGSGATPGQPVYGYQGPARVVYSLSQTQEGDAAGQDLYAQEVVVALPRTAGKAENALRVRVDAVDANGPQALVRRVLVVRSSLFSSYTMEQLVFCIDDQSNQVTP